MSPFKGLYFGSDVAPTLKATVPLTGKDTGAASKTTEKTWRYKMRSDGVVLPSDVDCWGYPAMFNKILNMLK